MAGAIIFVITIYLTISITAVFPVLIKNFFTIDSIVIFIIICILLLTAAFSGLILTGIRCAIKSAKRDDIIEKAHIFVKLAPVPLFVINFIFLALFFPTLFPAIVFIIPVNGLMCCTAIAMSGLTGFRAFRKAEKEGVIAKKYLLIFQFIPVLDVISTIILINKQKTAE